MQNSYRALRVSENAGQYIQEICDCPWDTLPEHPITVRVHSAALNYKDALSASGHKGVTRHYPHTPGIDAAGIVEASEDPSIPVGRPVIVTSYDLGMNTPGGLAEYIRVPAEWIVPLPEGLSLEESMIMGTGGLTAAMALHKLQHNGVHPNSGPVVVTGASGGVGSMAVSILAQADYEVWAVTGSPEAHAWLQELGASQCLSREELQDESGRPLLRPRWAGAIDTVGGQTLSNLLKATQKEGVVAACGLVQSPELALTVYPFILNGIHLVGIDSAEYPMPLRQKLWQKLAQEWKPPGLQQLKQCLNLEDVPEALQRMLQGQTRGRLIVKLV